MTRPRLLPLPLLTPAAGCHCPTCPFFIHNPSAVEPVCSGSNSDCSYCGCARTEARTLPADRAMACQTCPIRCGSRVDIAAWMADIGGTVGFDDLTMTGQLPPGLPRYIPQVDGSAIPDFDADLSWPAYAVGLRRVFSPDTFAVYPKFAGAAGAHDALGLRPDQQAVLVGYGTDPLVEAFWSRRRVARLVEQIAAQRWDLVLTPNYSLYQNQPRTEHLINFRRNLMIAAEFSAAGVTAAPNLYWMRLEDLDRYLGWLADVTPPAIAINLQTFRQASSWEAYALPGLTYLAATLPATLPVILTGTSRVDRIAALSALFGERLILVSQNAAQYALHGAVMTADGRVDVHARAADCFAQSTRFLASLLPTPSSSPGRG